MVSYNKARFVLLLIERNAHKQLNINSTKQTAVPWSIIVVFENLKNFIEVNTRKQNPSKLEAAFNICGDLFSFSFILNRCHNNILGEKGAYRDRKVSVAGYF